MKQKSNTLYWAILLIGLLIFCELLSFAALKMLPKQIDVSVQNTTERIDEKYQTILHPYVGYLSKPVSRAVATNVQNAALGKNKDENTKLVVMVGGSVANQVGVSQEGRNGIISTLKNTDALKDSTIELVTIAAGGHKQPQQLMIISYLLSLGAEIDMIINLDGFNDVVLPLNDNRNNGVFPYYPRNWHLFIGDIFDAASLRSVGKMSALEDSFDRWSNVRMPLFSLKLVQRTRLFLLARSMDIHLRSFAEMHIDASNFAAKGPIFDELPDDAAAKEAVHVWAQSSAQIRYLAQANGIEYYHFLQPNQYDPEGKTLNEQELSVAYDAEHPYKYYAEIGYPLLKEKSAELIGAGEKFFDLTDIFNNMNEAIYKDTCCHVNKRGDQILGEAIGRAIVNDIQYSTTR